MLAGEAGIGKTFLAHTFAQHAHEQGALVIWGHCFEGEWQPPYGPWVGALREYVNAVEPQRLQTEIGLGAPYLAKLVPEISLIIDSDQQALPLSPDEERVRIFDAITQWLVAGSRQQPIVVILDDLHWANPESLLLLQYIVRSTYQARLLIVGTYRVPDLDFERNQPLSDTLAMLARGIDFQRVTLQGLTFDEIADYLRETARRDPPHDLVRLVHQETRGNPFYTRELFQHLLEEGKVLDAAGGWISDLSSHELGIPHGVDHVLRLRLGRLSEKTKHLLQLAAVLTGGFDLPLLEALSSLPEDALLDCLDEAIASGLIRTVQAPATTYDFAHAIIRHTLYEQFNPDRRIRLHRQTAEALESLISDQDSAFIGELATQYHASRALPGAQRGIRYALAAAEEARQSYAHQRCVHFLRLARDLSTSRSPGERAKVLADLAVAEADALSLDEAQKTTDAAIAAFLQADARPQTVAAFLVRISRRFKEAGAPSSTWDPLVARGLALIGEQHDLTWARLALLRDRWEHITSAKIHFSRWLGYDPEAVAILREHGDENDYAQTLEPFDWRTQEETAQALELARRWETPTAVIRALNVAGRDGLFFHGAFPKAEARGRELLVFASRCGSLVGQAEALVLIAAAQAAMGKLDLAAANAEAAHEVISRLGEVHRLHVVIEVALASVLAYYLDEEWPRLVERAMELATEPSRGRWGMFGLYFPAFASLGHVRLGQEDAALELLDQLTPLLEQVDPKVVHQPISVHAAGSAVWEMPAPEFAPRYQQLALQVLEAGVGDSQLGSSQLTAARMLALQGELSEAKGYFDQARQQAQTNQQKGVRAIIDYDHALALIRLESGDIAQISSLLQGAAESFANLGMASWEERSARLLAELPGDEEPQTGALPDDLTPREAQVLGLIAQGLTNKEIAEQLVISVATVERHISNLYRKIDARGRADATAYAFTHELVDER